MAEATLKSSFPVKLNRALRKSIVERGDPHVPSSKGYVSIKYNFKPPSIASTSKSVLYSVITSPSHRNISRSLSQARSSSLQRRDEQAEDAAAEWTLEIEGEPSSMSDDKGDTVTKSSSHAYKGTQSAGKDMDFVLVWNEHEQTYKMHRLTATFSLKLDRSHNQLTPRAKGIFDRAGPLQLQDHQEVSHDESDGDTQPSAFSRRSRSTAQSNIAPRSSSLNSTSQRSRLPRSGYTYEVEDLGGSRSDADADGDVAMLDANDSEVPRGRKRERVGATTPQPTARSSTHAAPPVQNASTNLLDSPAAAVRQKDRATASARIAASSNLLESATGTVTGISKRKRDSLTTDDGRAPTPRTHSPALSDKDKVTGVSSGGRNRSDSGASAAATTRGTAPPSDTDEPDMEPASTDAPERATTPSTTTPLLSAARLLPTTPGGSISGSGRMAGDTPVVSGSASHSRSSSTHRALPFLAPAPAPAPAPPLSEGFDAGDWDDEEDEEEDDESGEDDEDEEEEDGSEDDEEGEGEGGDEGDLDEEDEQGLDDFAAQLDMSLHDQPATPVERAPPGGGISGKRRR